MMIQGCFWVLLLIANEICGSLFSANLGITYVLMAILEYGKSTELEFRTFFRIVIGGGNCLIISELCCLLLLYLTSHQKL